MNILDTDVLSLLLRGPSATAREIQGQIEVAQDIDFRISVVSVYELVGGAVDLIRNTRKQEAKHLRAHQLLQDIVEYLANWRGLILPYDDVAQAAYRGFSPEVTRQLSKKGDSWIAAIALANGAAVWTLNVRHFALVHNLPVYRADTGEQIS